MFGWWGVDLPDVRLTGNFKEMKGGDGHNHTHRTIHTVRTLPHILYRRCCAYQHDANGVSLEKDDRPV